MGTKIKFANAQKKLVIQWVFFSASIFLIYFIQTLTGKFEGNVNEVWEWLLQYIVPPLTLMIGVLINQVSSGTNEKETEQFYYRLASGTSYFFLILLLLSSVIVPFIQQSQASNMLVTEITHDNQKTIVEAFKQYNTFLIPVQGIATLSLGLFFTKTSD